MVLLHLSMFNTLEKSYAFNDLIEYRYAFLEWILRWDCYEKFSINSFAVACKDEGTCV